jgi:putative Mn2+ efflux pump MntP
MNWIENSLILAGISLDIFAAMECQGSLVAKINKKQLSGICVLVAGWQVIALFVGYLLSALYCKRGLAANEQLLGDILSMVIFVGLGIRLLVKAILNERIEEHLETDLGLRRFVRMASVSSIYTLLAGIAFGFLGTNLAVTLVLIVVFTVAFVIGGMYTGYRLGFASKTIVYIIGACLLWLAGLDVLLHRIIG